jgi:hypothetical protein
LSLSVRRELAAIRAGKAIRKCQTGNGVLTPFLRHDQEANFDQSAGVIIARESHIPVEATGASKAAKHTRIRSVAEYAVGSGFFNVDQHESDSPRVVTLACLDESTLALSRESER